MRSHKQSGFTIVELVVTIVILALSVPVMASLVNLLSSLNDRARDMAQIHALTEHKIEALRSMGFTTLTNGTTNFTSELSSSIAAPRSATYTISSASSSVKQIDVSVSYNDHGTTRTLSYRTYIGELGVGQY
jgi:prepilin-type N-terminal cleavage/methylation domain-containing protein